MSVCEFDKVQWTFSATLSFTRCVHFDAVVLNVCCLCHFPALDWCSSFGWKISDEIRFYRSSLLTHRRFMLHLPSFGFTVRSLHPITMRSVRPTVCVHNSVSHSNVVCRIIANGISNFSSIIESRNSLWANNERRQFDMNAMQYMKFSFFSAAVFPFSRSNGESSEHHKEKRDTSDRKIFVDVEDDEWGGKWKMWKVKRFILWVNWTVWWKFSSLMWVFFMFHLCCGCNIRCEFISVAYWMKWKENSLEWNFPGFLWL